MILVVLDGKLFCLLVTLIGLFGNFPINYASIKFILKLVLYFIYLIHLSIYKIKILFYSYHHKTQLRQHFLPCSSVWGLSASFTIGADFESFFSPFSFLLVFYFLFSDYLLSWMCLAPLPLEIRILLTSMNVYSTLTPVLALTSKFLDILWSWINF